MKTRTTGFGGIALATALVLAGVSARAGTLTPTEVAQIESALGITLSAQEKADLGAIVKPDSSPAWRTAAEARIQTHRKADLQVQVEDANGNPVPYAQVAVKLKRNAFNFGGILTLKDLTDEDGNLEISTARYRDLFRALYNSAGLDNGFKPKQRAGNEALIPGFLQWAQTNAIPVRGHLLIWPGTPSNNHLPEELPDTPTSYSILSKVQAVEAALTNGSSQTMINALKADLRQEINYMIGDWASKWNVYEWDVINETLSNYRVQNLLGDEEMAEWFKIAASNAVDPNCQLMINEYQIISARSASLDPGNYTSRKTAYMANIDLILANGGRIDRIGFQNRIKFEVPNPLDWYNRLNDFSTKYGLPMVGTEFEVRDTDPPTSTYYPYDYTEEERAQITESLLTTYYSHPLAAGLNAWTYMKNVPYAMCNYDGSVKLNGLAWYYLHRIRYNTDTNATSGIDGSATINGFKGDYDLTVTYNGNAYPATVTLASNQTALVTLGDVVLASNHPPAFTSDPVTLASATSGVAYAGQTLAGSATDLDGNPLAYVKIAGPAWLAIAVDGTLSGTPSSADAGQNSWIVQVSDGFDTDTAVFKIDVAGTGGPGANISINQVQTLGWNVPAGTSGTSSYSGISAQLGDVIVLTVSGNKKGSVIPLSCAKVGGTGGVGAQTELTNGLDTYPTAWAWYYTVTAPGTFAFDITTDNTQGITAITALYVLRAGSGSIALADSATWDDTDNANNGTAYSLSYSFAAALPGGVLIESVNSRTDLITEPAAYTEDRNAGPDKRLLVSFDGVTGSSWTSAYSLSGGTAGTLTSGAVGMIFNEVLGGGNQPPEFSSDPVTEATAFQGAAYSSALADNASDGDLDTLAFGKVSGPAWLAVAANGALSGTPQPGDLGANRWKILVTDGTATNFANLEITVSNPPPSPYQGTNVLFIAVDDFKPLLGCYGDPLAITPNIDSLAAAGVAFQNAQCQWAVCGPSRASLMTGLYPEETGVMGFKTMRGNDNVKRPNLVTIQQWFRYHGYRTAGTGKINDPRCVGSMDPLTGVVTPDSTVPVDVDDPPSWGEPVDPNNLPADFFSSSAYVPYPSGWSPAGNPSTGSANLPDSDFQDGKICDLGISMLQGLATNDTQFFLGVGFKKPHLPFVAPQYYWNLYDRSDFVIAPFQGHPLHEVSYTWNYAAELATYDDIADPTNIPAAKQLELIHGYYACASFIDAQVGRLLDELETLGLHTNTIVVLWGDHGFHLGDHAEWAKHTNLEQAARVPLVIYSPFTGVAGAKPGSPAGFVDIYPTLCELAGLPVPQQPLNQNEDPFAPASGRALKGKSLVPVMQDPSVSLRTGALTLFARNGAMGYAYRTERYRYIEWISGGTVVARELYDYALDPLETVNLAGEPGHDALMLQFSRSMRAEMGDLGLGGGDIACDELQGAPAYDTAGGDYTLPITGWAQSGQTFELNWPDAYGQTYTLLVKTNLADAAWQVEQGGLTAGEVEISADKAAAFYRIELE